MPSEFVPSLNVYRKSKERGLSAAPRWRPHTMPRDSRYPLQRPPDPGWNPAGGLLLFGFSFMLIVFASLLGGKGGIQFLAAFLGIPLLVATVRGLLWEVTTDAVRPIPRRAALLAYLNEILYLEEPPTEKTTPRPSGASMLALLVLTALAILRVPLFELPVAAGVSVILALAMPRKKGCRFASLPRVGYFALLQSSTRFATVASRLPGLAEADWHPVRLVVCGDNPIPPVFAQPALILSHLECHTTAAANAYGVREGGRVRFFAASG